MGNPNYQTGIACLQENIRLLTDVYGKVAPENIAIWNVSNALLVILDAVRGLDARMQRIEQQLQR